MTQSYEMAVFCRVIEAGSFAAAAEGLGLSPSAVSKIVTRTEKRLGVQLMTRTTRQLALTGDGEIYLARAREILAAIEEAEAEVARAGAIPSGRLRISCGTAFGNHLLLPALGEFRDRYPGIHIELGSTDRVVDLIAEHIDVAIRTGPLGDSSLVARKICDSRRVICASPAYLARHGTPRVPADLVNHNCMAVSGMPHLHAWPFVTPEGINRLAVTGDFTSDSADALRAMALSGQGIIRLARFLVAADIAAGRLVQILADYEHPETFSISAVMPPGRHRAPRVRAFVDFLMEKFADANF
jgi:Transcriptional regulator